MDLTEAEHIEKRRQEYTEEQKQIFMTQITIMVWEPSILESKVKWALGSIVMNKANGGDGIPVELLQILFFFFFIVVDFVIHWNETAMGLHVFPIPIPPPTSLSTRSL